MEDKVHGTFVGEKINKVRWKPEDLVESDIFLTGSWDNGVRNIHLLQNFKQGAGMWNIII
jgi:nuclear pore complex protein Nup43